MPKYVLVDCPDDGLDERGWVSAEVERGEAEAALKPLLLDPELLQLDSPTQVWLRPHEAGDDHGWVPAEPGEPGALRFWQFDAVERPYQVGA